MKTYFPPQNLWRHTLMRSHCQKMVFGDGARSVLRYAYQIDALKREQAGDKVSRVSNRSFLVNYFQAYPDSIPSFLPVEIHASPLSRLVPRQDKAVWESTSLNEKLNEAGLLILLTGARGSGKSATMLSQMFDCVSEDGHLNHLGFVPCFVSEWNPSPESESASEQVIYQQLITAGGFEGMNPEDLASYLRAANRGENLRWLFLFDLDKALSESRARHLAQSIRHFASTLAAHHRIVVSLRNEQQSRAVFDEFDERAVLWELQPLKETVAVDYLQADAEGARAYSCLSDAQKREFLPNPLYLDMLRLKAFSEPEQLKTAPRVNRIWRSEILAYEHLKGYRPQREVKPSLLRDWHSLQTTFETVAENRDAEISRFLSVLEANKLLLISGMAGIGKTTLMRALIEFCPPDVPAPFWFDFYENPTVSLESLLEHLAEYLDLPALTQYKQEQRPPDERDLKQLTDELGDARTCWLLFDNLDVALDENFHFQDDSIHDFFAALYRHEHGSKILITSRELPILKDGDVLGEKQDIAGLALPFAVAYLQQTLDRKGVKGDETELQELAKRVEGHPLALRIVGELIARHGVTTILNDSSLWQARSRDVLRTARRLFDKLTGSESDLLQRLSVYRRPVPFAALSVMCSEVIPQSGIDTLLDKSLLEVEQSREPYVYRLHPLVREFAAEDFLAKGQEEVHAVHTVAANCFRREELTREDAFDFVERHYHLQQAGEYLEAAELVEEIATDMLRWGYWTDLEQMLNASIQSVPDERGKLYRYHGQLFDERGNFTTAEDSFEKALSVLRKHGEREEQGRVLSDLGNLFRKRGEYDRALSHYDKAQEQYEAAWETERNVSNRAGIAQGHLNRGVIYALQRRYSEALPHCQNALEIYQELEDSYHIGLSYNNIGGIYLLQDRYENAQEAFQNALACEEWRSSPQEEARAHHNIGYVYLHLGEYEQALDNYQKAFKIQEELGDSYAMGQSYCNIGEALYHQGHHDRALQQYQKALETAREIGDPFVEAASLNNIGELRQAQGDYEAAGQKYNEALKIVEDKLQDERMISIIFHNFGELNRLQRRYPQALEMYHKSLELKSAQDYKYGIADTYCSLGLLYAAQGDQQNAQDYLTQARDIAAQLGAKALLEKAENELSRRRQN